MRQFKIIYKILSHLANSMDYKEVDTDYITAQSLGISEEMRNSIIILLLENEYIKGVEVKEYVHSTKPTITNLNNIKITLKGLEYLEENTTMKKLYNLAKGIKDTTPFI
ncbi:MAG: YjcQ family protein [Anaerorhabdus sp.]